MMFVARFVVAIWCCASFVLARKIPYYDTFDDDFYSELRNLLEEHQNGKGTPPVAHPREVRGWADDLGLGQVSGISVDPQGHPVIFHRGSRIWDYSSFNATHHFQETTPLDDEVVVVLDAQVGTPLRSWGRGRFLMPHGITVDDQGNTWLTDVALHQVFKFTPESEDPVLALGEAGIPGSDDHHFCKPTSVAVASSGEFFVADGYCNGRIMRFHPDGSLMSQFGHLGNDGSSRALYVPHGLALDEGRDALCVADRENRRVLCVRAGLRQVDDFGETFMTLQEPNQGRVFDVASVNGVLVGVAGSEDEGTATGFTADLNSGKLLDAWGPVMGFHNPHSVAVSRDGAAIYVAEIGPNRIWKFLLESPTPY